MIRVINRRSILKRIASLPLAGLLIREKPSEASGLTDAAVTKLYRAIRPQVGTCFTVANTSGIGKPIRVFDASDQEIPDLVECDTKTGRVVQYVRDCYGWVIDEDNGCIERRELYVPAPLRVERLRRASVPDVMRTELGKPTISQESLSTSLFNIKEATDDSP